MNRMTRLTPIAAVLATLAFAASPALAGDGKGHKGPKGHHGKGPHAAAMKGDNGLHLGWYKQQWRRGDRIVWADVQPTYYVYDYQRYNLRPAPVGYRWVRPMDNRYLLVEIASGLIADAIGY